MISLEIVGFAVCMSLIVGLFYHALRVLALSLERITLLLASTVFILLASSGDKLTEEQKKFVGKTMKVFRS